MQRPIVVIGIFLCALQSSPVAAACPGDCGADGQVTVNELIQGVNIALGSAAVGQCPSFDTNGDREVTIDELIAAVNAALNGCTTGDFSGNYAATVRFDSTYSGTINLSANATGQVSGSLLVAGPPSGARTRAPISFTFPVGGGSVAVSGTYDLASGGFEVEGSFVDANGQTIPVVISGDLPGPTGTAPINVYVGSDPPFSSTLSAGMIATPSPTPVPTPPPGNGPRIVYSAPDHAVPDIFDIFAINIDGSGMTKLFHSPGYDTNPAWSPDGTKIAFAAPDVGNQHIGIAVMNSDGSGLRRLAEESAFLDAFPAWSLDGSRIAFTAGGGNAIEAMNADGSNRIRLVTKLAGDKYGHLSWSPDGSKIAFESTRGKPSNHAADYEIFVMNADGSGITPLTNNAVEDHHPDWSPNGQTIVFGRGVPSVGVYSIKPDGSGEKRLITDPFVFGVPSPNWSRDGQQLAYQTFLGLKITDANGANAVTVPGTSFLADFDLK